MRDDAGEGAYTALRRAILELDLTPGQPVSERFLGEEVGASRTPIRAALARLADEGLVERYRRSWRVTPVDVVDVDRAMQFRMVIELGALDLAAPTATPTALRNLQQDVENSFARPQSAIHDGDSFHTQLVGLSGNAYLRQALDEALTRLARPRWVAAQDGDARSRARDEHLIVLARLADADLEGARQALRRHISDLSRRLTSTLVDERKRLRVFSIANG